MRQAPARFVGRAHFLCRRAQGTGHRSQGPASRPDAGLSRWAEAHPTASAASVGWALVHQTRLHFPLAGRRRAAKRRSIRAQPAAKTDRGRRGRALVERRQRNPLIFHQIRGIPFALACTIMVEWTSPAITLFGACVTAVRAESSSRPAASALRSGGTTHGVAPVSGAISMPRSSRQTRKISCGLKPFRPPDDIARVGGG